LSWTAGKYKIFARGEERASEIQGEIDWLNSLIERIKDEWHSKDRFFYQSA